MQTEHWLDAGPGDAVWSTADTGNALAVWNTLIGPWSRGAEVVLHHNGAFDPAERLDLIDRLDTTILCQSPADYAALTELRAFHRYRPRRLRRLVSTGDTLARDVIATYEEVWGMTIHEGYGQAETAVVVANGVDAGFRPGSVGLPIAGHEVAVIDEQGNVLGPGVEGELGLRGRPPSLFSHYWGAPEETKAAFRGDWFVTGDIASTDEDGFVWLVGRTEDVITSRGRRFGPFEVEHALREHEAVAESAAVGIRDLERGGQFVRAFVVLRAGATPSEQLEAHLRNFVESTLPEYAVPREIEFMDKLPRTPSGNIRRAELRERQVAGRPLWETAPVTEPEALLPSPEPKPKPPAEPEGFVVQEYFPQVQPVAEPVAELTRPTEPEPVAYAEPAPPAPGGGRRARADCLRRARVRPPDGGRRARADARARGAGGVRRAGDCLRRARVRPPDGGRRAGADARARGAGGVRRADGRVRAAADVRRACARASCCARRGGARASGGLRRDTRT